MALHKHKCPDSICNRIWEHDDLQLSRTDEMSYNDAHKCPDCGSEQRVRFFANEEEENEFYKVKFMECVQRLDELSLKAKTGELTFIEALEAFELASMLGISK